MHRGLVVAVATAWLSGVNVLAAPAASYPPLALHPENPRYFLFRGKPAVLLTSGEHYGAVLNLDFDYRKYLAALERDGMNLTRAFSGAYVEPHGAFNIARNTLAPAAGRFICPWARSGEPGYPNDGWNSRRHPNSRGYSRTHGARPPAQSKLCCRRCPTRPPSVSPAASRQPVTQAITFVWQNVSHL